MSDERESAIVFAGNTVDADFLRTLLEAEGVEVFLKDEHMGTLAPFHFYASSAGAVKVLVKTADLEIAKPIVAEFMRGNEE